MSAVGAALGSPVKNTAVPGTRCGGLASSLRRSQSRSASFLRVCLTRRREPLTQVTITRATQLAISRGTQAPSKSFSMFAAKNACSTRRSGTIRAATCHSFHPHIRQMTKNAMSDAMIICAVTATPYAEARLLEFLNSSTISMTATSRIQFTRGM